MEKLRSSKAHLDRRQLTGNGSTKSSEVVSTGNELFDAKLLVRLHDDVLGEKLKSTHDWKIEMKPNIT